MNKKSLIIASILTWSLLLSTGVANAYDEINCSTDSIFVQNNCDQCFDWGSVKVWNTKIDFSDEYKNPSWNSKILYDVELKGKFPFIVNLWWSASEWQTIPWEEGFWTLTDSLKNLEVSGYWQTAYEIPANSRVTRIKSNTWYWYRLVKNTVASWKNVWMIVFPVVSHDVIDWVVSSQAVEHRECVLFKSDWPGEVETTVPPTWPEHILLLWIALFLAIFYLGLRRKNNA